MTSPERAACGPILLSTDIDLTHPLAKQLEGPPLVLMVQRGFRAPRFPGLHTIPTGVVDNDESEESTIAREAMEELNIEILPGVTFVHSGFIRGFRVSYYRCQWRPVQDTPLLKRSPNGKIENIGFSFLSIPYAIGLGRQHQLVFADALAKLLV